MCKEYVIPNDRKTMVARKIRMILLSIADISRTPRACSIIGKESMRDLHIRRNLIAPWTWMHSLLRISYQYLCTSIQMVEEIWFRWSNLYKWEFPNPMEGIGPKNPKKMRIFIYLNLWGANNCKTWAFHDFEKNKSIFSKGFNHQMWIHFWAYWCWPNFTSNRTSAHI